MTIAATRGTELNIDEILTLGLQMSGVLDAGQPADEVDLGMGRQVLGAVSDALLVEGTYARSVEFFEVTLTAGTAFYSMSSDVLDIIGDGAYIDPSNASTANASGETPVVQMDREEWQRLSTKDSDGRPYKFYLHRAKTPLQVRLWPTPDEAGTIRFQAQQLTADTTDGSKTADYRKVWTQYLIWEMAHHFAVAKSLPVDKLSYLHKRAKELKDVARGFGQQNVNNYMRYAVPNRWRGR